MSKPVNPEWNANDAAALSDFLNKNPKFLAELETRMPSIETKTVEGAAMSGARHAGAEDLLKAIRGMVADSGEVRSTGFIDQTRD